MTLIVGFLCFIVGAAAGYGICLRRNKAIVAAHLAKLDMYTGEVKEWGQAMAAQGKAKWDAWLEKVKARYGL